MILINLSPHPMRVYPPDTPDRVDPATVAPVRILPPTNNPVRATEQVLSDPWHIQGVPVVDVHSGPGSLPRPQAGTCFVVSRPVALSCPDRTDLLVIHRAVRDVDGHTIGCRGFARIISRTVRTEHQDAKPGSHLPEARS